MKKVNRSAKYLPLISILVIASMLIAPFQATAESYGTSEIDSVASDGSLPNNGSNETVVSADGRYVYFSSYATNLVSNDTNSALDIFMRDRLTGATTRLDISSSGDQANYGADNDFAISDGGRYLVFSSPSTNLVDSEYNQNDAIFIRDLKSGTVSLLYQNHFTGQTAGDVSISGNGNWIAFTTDQILSPYNDQTQNVYIINRKTLALTRISNEVNGGAIPYNYYATQPDVNYDGSKVVFASNDPNLVNGDTNSAIDDFLWNQATNSITRVDVSSSGGQASSGVATYAAPQISGDGNEIVFTSGSTNLVSPATAHTDVYLHQVDTGTTALLSTTPDSQEGNASSGGGIGFSKDGNYVVFQSYATDLVPNDTFNKSSIFVRDIDNDSTTQVNLDPDGNLIQEQGSHVSISADGQYVTFTANLPTGPRAVYMRY